MFKVLSMYHFCLCLEIYFIVVSKDMLFWDIFNHTIQIQNRNWFDSEYIQSQSRNCINFHWLAHSKYIVANPVDMFLCVSLTHYQIENVLIFTD